MSALDRPRLAPHAWLRRDADASQGRLVGPEAVLLLDECATAILELCDGRSLASLCAALAQRYESVDGASVRAFLQELQAGKWIRDARS
jgi:hypothetical protein